MIEVRNLVHAHTTGASNGVGTATDRSSRAASPAVDGISLTIADGSFVVLAGPNGAGKTTLVRHFNGLLAPDSGEVLVDGTPVQDDLVAARTKVGMVFQHPEDQFVAATVGADVAFGPENLGLAREAIDRRVDDALAAVGMAGRHDDRVDQLSGGEQARVAIAGALAMSPNHLVLDEPFAGLDDPARGLLRDRLAARAADGTSIVVVTHDLRDVFDLADRLVVLRNGQVVLDDDPERARDQLADLAVRPP